jgi:hypothetical protein
MTLYQNGRGCIRSAKSRPLYKELHMHQPDETRFDLTGPPGAVCVTFDVRNDENCQISLDFTDQDIQKIAHMGTFGLRKISLTGINGSAALSSDCATIKFAYGNGRDEFGTVYYNYRRLVTLLNEAIEEMEDSID